MSSDQLSSQLQVGVTGGCVGGVDLHRTVCFLVTWQAGVPSRREDRGPVERRRSLPLTLECGTLTFLWRLPGWSTSLSLHSALTPRMGAGRAASVSCSPGKDSKRTECNRRESWVYCLYPVQDCKSLLFIWYNLATECHRTFHL